MKKLLNKVLVFLKLKKNKKCCGGGCGCKVETPRVDAHSVINTGLYKNETIDLVKSFGIEPRTNPVEYLANISKKFHELPLEYQHLIAVTVAGKNYAPTFKALMKND